MNRVAIKVVAIIAWMVYSCNGVQQSQKSPDISHDAKVDTVPIVVEAGKNETMVIALQLTQKFDVVFKDECVGCADIWRVKSMDKEKAVLLNETYAHWSGEGQPSGFSGGSQEHTFHFRAIGKGESKINFAYFDQTYVLSFSVK